MAVVTVETVVRVFFLTSLGLLFNVQAVAVEAHILERLDLVVQAVAVMVLNFRVLEQHQALH